MRVVTNEEVQSWLSAHPNLRWDGRSIYYDSAKSDCVVIDYEHRPYPSVFLMRLLGALGMEARYFGGALLWITEWGVWEDQDEAIGLKAVEKFRLGYGDARSLETASGHFFRHDEFADAVALLMQPVLMGWDAYYAPWWAHAGGDYFVHISHDSWLAVVTPTREKYENVMEILKNCDGKAAPAKTRERFCRPRLLKADG